jgi:hypothetical protein
MKDRRIQLVLHKRAPLKGLLWFGRSDRARHILPWLEKPITLRAVELVKTSGGPTLGGGQETISLASLATPWCSAARAKIPAGTIFRPDSVIRTIGCGPRNLAPRRGRNSS